ncbi:MAG TPA: NACHT domain-containing protein, partial [Methylomirabilota bacterium]|nr:NACHT domain-containing protein [Methylomirabilota bacterium]
MLYTFALKVWNISKWICLVFLIPTAVDLLKSVVAAKKPEDIFPNSFLFGSNYRTLTLSILSVLVAIALLARIIVLIGNHLHGSKPLQKYLRLVFEANQSLNPKGFAQQSQALISVNVPLDNIFINLHSVPDRPVYDVPSEQQKLLEELRRHSDLTPEELEERIQKLRVVWHSQLGQELSETRQMQNVSIKQVLQQLKANNQVAIILGAPGSGKTTAIRWLAFQMAQASFSPKYRLPKELSPRQIPVMLRISDYAKLLSIDDLSFEQFFKDQLAKVHPDLPSRGLEELEKGHCLLLLDGLDEVASDNLRRRIAEIISTFISKYSVEKPESKYYNRFIVTSRIVGYEPGSFAEHAHYTLLDLEDEQIEQFLTNWCPAVEIYQTMAAQGMKKLTSQQVTQANKSGAEQRDRLLDTL